jgi:hypothetical protein
MPALCQKEREVISDIVLHLSEIESRGSYRALGYSSLFTYCTEGCGYSEGAAMRRIKAARCVRDNPEVYEKLRCGKLTLCAISELARVLNAGNKEELIAICKSLAAEVDGCPACWGAAFAAATASQANRPYLIFELA